MPETSEYDDVLFIEAQLTDDPTIIPYVIISKTLPLTTQDSEPVPRSSAMISGASVIIQCDDGNDYLFSETDPGRYSPVDPLFIGQIGLSYKLSVLYDEETYESYYEILSASPPVDSLTEKAVREKTTDTGDPVYGLRFFANTHDQESEPSYYRWMLDATYTYIAPLFSTHRWIDNQVVFFENSHLRKCYKDKNLYGIYVSNTEGLERNVISDAPLHFESQYGDELSGMYCLHAKQLKISERCYKFWDDLSKLIYETGGLYESQPFRIKGNIECISDPGINIIGVFEVAGVSERRDYFPMPTEFDIVNLICSLEEVGSEELPWEDLDDGAFLQEGEPGAFSTGKPKCFDCQERGGTLDKPPFWEY
ncbi:MAG: DUF4249 domain-containing protein [Bacteroidales bacterium]|nr:DUF4249 domain-containing protein [Bacteroidales bacterium]